MVDLPNGRRLAVHHYVNDRPVLLLLHANGFPVATYRQLVTALIRITASRLGMHRLAIYCQSSKSMPSTSADKAIPQILQ